MNREPGSEQGENPLTERPSWLAGTFGNRGGHGNFSTVSRNELRICAFRKG
ncbi:MAG: hypothetical protein OXN84_19840 [Albidovulum sp.]|nr:hypothetical protein [Albidovulum sp.]